MLPPPSISDTVILCDLNRLRQLKQFLTDKLTLLAKLDDEIIELIDEEESLEHEVEQADGVREEIDIAILTIDDALLDCTRKSSLSVHETAH